MIAFTLIDIFMAFGTLLIGIIIGCAALVLFS